MEDSQAEHWDQGRVGLAVPAAGRGLRFGSPENKIWAQLLGRHVIEWTLEKFQNHDGIDEIVIAGSVEDLPRLVEISQQFSKVKAVIPGGATRAESVFNAVSELSDDCSIVLVHDAARPNPSDEMIWRVINSVRSRGSGIPGIAVSDTMKRCDRDLQIVETVSRDSLYRVQTPQGVVRSHLMKAYNILGEKTSRLTDESSILEAAGNTVYIVDGDSGNVKVTTPEDINALTVSMRSNAPKTPFPIIRTGLGYDVHQFAEGRELWIGGVNIPHNRGLKGHSDADVLLHAVCDALLGAAGMGDIGVLFPDSDQKHKDRASIEFLNEVHNRLLAEQWQVSNVDIALLAEEPRIMPFREQIGKVIGDCLKIDPSCVNLKATTAEKMGFVGRKEGMACWAIATILKYLEQ